ncbi:MAG: DNA sulfur modification protein DndB [Nitrosopumilus sp.]|nr:DNA sulfur modification protein DndB [Nitrosopumilus sp.]
MTFDAVRGVQAGKEFYSAMVSFKTIAEHFKFDDPSIGADQRAQRKIRESRIPQISNYITQNRDNYVFSSITVSVGGKMDFHPTPGLGELGRTGTLIISMNSPLLINDGQHRCTAIKDVYFKYKDLQNEKISVVFFLDKGLKRSQQMFADLNKHAVKPTKSLGLLYDHRDTFARFIVTLSKDVEIFNGRTEMERSSIALRSKNFFTLNGIADATRYLLKLKTKSIPADKQKLAVDFWETVTANMPDWQLLLDKDTKVSPADLRETYVHAYTNVLNAIGIAGHVLVTKYPDWEKMLKNLKTIPWERSDPIWEGKIMIDGKMIKNKVGIKKVADIILNKCGSSVTLDDFEKQEIAA